MEVCAVGLGCWAIGGPFWDQGGWMGYGDVDDAESLRALRRGLDLGIQFLDVADVYGCGHAERLVGQAIVGRREEVVLAVKFGYLFDETTRHVTGRNGTPEYARQACEASLRRLNTDYLDFFLLHLFDLDLAAGAAMRDALEGLVAEGKIRGYGWCTEDPERVRCFAEGQHCALVPHLANLFGVEDALLQLGQELNLASIARRPLGMGLLTGKFQPGSAFPNNDMRHRFGWDFRAGKQAVQLQQLSALQETLTQDGRTLAQAALAWLWARSPLLLPIPGFKNVAQVEENVGALERGALTPTQMVEIEQILRASRSPLND
jgi:aryl-alcohol dehydrogenase-like predicted oxidoreductase